MPPTPTISSRISTAWEAPNENASIPLGVFGALLGDVVCLHAASRPSALSTHLSCGQRTAELADLFRQLQFATLLRYDADQPSERKPIKTSLDVSNQASRSLRSLPHRGRWDHVHHRAAE